jgi:hypothetical protein
LHIGDSPSTGSIANDSFLVQLRTDDPGHKPYFTARSKSLSRSTYEWQDSGAVKGSALARARRQR